MAGTFIAIGIYFFTSLIMVSVGVINLRSKKPVNFYTGEKPLKEDEITDIKAWNRKHGIMWVLYGIFMFVTFLAGILVFRDSHLGIVLMIGGTILPIFPMMWYHHVLWKKYGNR